MSCFKQLAQIVENDLKIQEPRHFEPRIIPIHQTTRTTTPPISWQRACVKSGIQGIYHNASLDNCPMLPIGIVEIGKKWVKASNRPSLYLHGNTGSGKTYFSTALYRALVEQQHPWVIYVKSYDLDEELLTAIEEKQEKSRIMKYCEVPILFIDDLGVERPSERMLRQYFSIIDKRVGDRLITVITSNIPRDQLPLGDRVISRLEHFYAIEFPKKDNRKNLELPPL